MRNKHMILWNIALLCFIVWCLFAAQKVFAMDVDHRLATEDIQMYDLNFEESEILAKHSGVFMIDDSVGWKEVLYNGKHYYVQSDAFHSSRPIYSKSEFIHIGVIKWDGWTWTWYSTNEAGQTVTAKPISGKHTDANGYILDGDGYLCIASNNLDFYETIPTPFGYIGKVYDCGCSGIDVYTTW